MPLPLPKVETAHREVECIFRPVRGEDGELRIEQVPATLENLLNPRLEDQLTQSNGHLLIVVPLFDALKRYLRRLIPNLAVLSDMMLLYKRHGYRDVSPDIAIVEGLPPELVAAIDTPDEQVESVDVIAEGGRLRLVMEVVSTSTADMRRKDEVKNPPLFAALGVEDLVLIYLPENDEPLRVVARRLTAPGQYSLNPPGPEGWIRLRSVGLALRVDEAASRLVLKHPTSGEFLLTSQEEEEGRRAEKRRADEAETRVRAESLVEILDARGFCLDDDDRGRILDCRDVELLVRWTRLAFSVETLDDLWKDRRS